MAWVWTMHKFVLIDSMNYIQFRQVRDAGFRVNCHTIHNCCPINAYEIGFTPISTLHTFLWHCTYGGIILQPELTTRWCTIRKLNEFINSKFWICFVRVIILSPEQYQFLFISRKLSPIDNECVTIGGSRGVCPAHVPHKSPDSFISTYKIFETELSREFTPATRFTPPYGKSWIRHWLLTCCGWTWM